MIKIIIDWRKLKLIWQNVVKYLICRRAYKGYCAWLKYENIEPLLYSEFRKFEYWKIELAFRQYLGWCQKKDYHKAKISFKSVVLNHV